MRLGRLRRGLLNREAFNNLLRILLAFVSALLISQLNLEYFESLLYDIRIKYRPTPPLTGNIELILVRPETVESLRRFPNIEDQSALLLQLQESNPKSVVYVQLPEETQGTTQEFSDFSDLARRTPFFFATKDELLLPGEISQLDPKPGTEKLPRFSAIPTYDNQVFADDGVTRRALLTYGDEPLLSLFLARLYNPVLDDKRAIRGRFEFLKTDQIYIDFNPSGTYPVHEFSDVLQGEVPPETFTGKIVLVGFDVEKHSKNYIRTPYSREVVAMTTTEMYANIIDSLIRNSAPVRLPPWTRLLFTLLIAIITVNVTLTVKPARGLLILLATVVGYFALTYLAMWPFGYWVPLAHPLLAVFLCYYFFIPYRLIIENRRSWEYYQKNRLLTQVEELKTNFISMMSHDLKTPLARIQGMTEMVLRDSNNLNPEQQQAISTIKSSSRDLLEFITSILSFGRVESEGVKLHLQSRDINTLIDEVIQKVSYHANQKNIQILTEKEPLFSIPMDVDLVGQVLSNLLENAVKYSPEGSKVLVTTEEAEGQIIVQVSDQGMGIPKDEVSNIFMKFFRSKQAKISSTRGSGLGLYLAKYFIELHKGTIAVESEEGQGSTFTLTLPVNLK